MAACCCGIATTIPTAASSSGPSTASPSSCQPFIVPVAPPGDDLKPESFVAFWSDGGFGIYIHPGIWHEGVFPVTPTGRFFDKQGKVHARVSCDLAREFGMLLGVPLPHAM